MISADLSKSKYHNLYILYQQSYGHSDFILEWASPSISRQIIPTSNYYSTRLVGSSPFQITVSCPVGYTANIPSSPNTWVAIWGDGIKAGSETCDDGTVVKIPNMNINFKYNDITEPIFLRLDFVKLCSQSTKTLSDPTASILQ